MARWWQFQNKTDPITPQFFAGTGTAIVVNQPVEVQSQVKFQYDSQSDPTSATQFVPRFLSTWFQEWVPPLRPRIAPTLAIALGASGLFAPPTQPNASVTTAPLIPAWSEPVRQKIGLPAHQQQVLAWNTTTPTTETITEDKWHYAWSEPVRLKRGIGQYLQDTGAPDVVNPPPVLVSQWFNPLSEPVRIKQGLTAQQQQFFAWGYTTPASVVVNLGWLQPLSSPVQSKIVVSAATFDFMSVERALTNFWYAPWPDFAYQKKSILAAQQQTLAWSNFTPAQAVTNDIRWLYQWSEPVRTRKFGPQLQDIGAPDVVLPPPVLVAQWSYGWNTPPPSPFKVSFSAVSFATVDPALTNFWYQPWPDFAPGKKFLTAQQQVLAWNTTTPVVTAQVSTTALSSPVFFKGRVIYSSYVKPVFVAGDITNVGRWFIPWSEPVRTRSFAACQQQVLAWSNFTPAAGVVPEDRWHQPWSEPVRLKRLPTADLVAAPIQTIQPPTILVSQWIYGWSEPVRVKVGLPAYQQQFLAAPSQVIPRPTAVIATTPSSPVFFKGRLIYQSYTKPYFPIAAPTVSFGWFQPLASLPLRARPVVSSSIYPFNAIATQVIVTLNATETNNDIALFGVAVYNPATGCNVSIREIPAINRAAVSVEEVAAINGAAASIEET